MRATILCLLMLVATVFGSPVPLSDTEHQESTESAEPQLNKRVFARNGKLFGKFTDKQTIGFVSDVYTMYQKTGLDKTPTRQNTPRVLGRPFKAPSSVSQPAIPGKSQNELKKVKEISNASKKPITWATDSIGLKAIKGSST